MLSPEEIRRLPKVQLHCHLEGTVRPATFLDIAARHGMDVAERASSRAGDVYAFSTFRDFLLLFAEVCRALRTPDDLGRIAAEYAQDAIAQGVAYAEVFISPSVWTYFHPSLNVRDAVARIRDAVDGIGRGQLEVRLIADLTRNFGARRALESVRQAAELRDLGVIGIGLGGDEENYPPALFRDAFMEARRRGLHTVAHAGEAAGPQSIRAALEIGAERIGHGVTAVQDVTLMQELVRRGVAIEVCHTSNRRTGAWAAGEAHPLLEFDRHGVLCVIDTDDPALFETTLCDEYGLAQELIGAAGVLRCARAAVDASFASEDTKTTLHRALAQFERERATAARAS